MPDATTIAKALHEFQKHAPALQRDKINPAFKSKYLSLEKLLEEVLPALNAAGLVIVQAPTFVMTDAGTQEALQSFLIHAASGERIDCTILLNADKKGPQAQGAALTYARRYTLMSLLGLSADADDDGAAASSQRRASSNGAISDAQRTRLRAIQREAAVTDERLRELVKEIAGVESSKDISKAKYDALVAAVEAEKAA